MELDFSDKIKLLGISDAASIEAAKKKPDFLKEGGTEADKSNSPKDAEGDADEKAKAKKAAKPKEESAKEEKGESKDEESKEDAKAKQCLDGCKCSACLAKAKKATKPVEGSPEEEAGESKDEEAKEDAKAKKSKPAEGSPEEEATETKDKEAKEDKKAKAMADEEYASKKAAKQKVEDVEDLQKEAPVKPKAKAAKTCPKDKMMAHLKARVSEFNESHDSQISFEQLRVIYNRGTSIFASTHKPGKSRNQWGLARVNSFIKMMEKKPVSEGYLPIDQDVAKASRGDVIQDSAGKEFIGFEEIEFMIAKINLIEAGFGQEDMNDEFEF